MKLRYIIGAVLSTFLLAACQQEELVGKFEDLSVEQSFISISMEGGNTVLKVSSSDNWAFAKSIDSGKKDDAGKTILVELPGWLTASTLSGTPGTTDVTLAAESTAGGREAELEIVSGSKTVFVRVRQGSLEATKATVKEIYEGPDGKTFRVTGTCTGIYNTTYGNWYLDDGTNGDNVLTIYGTLDKDGKTKNFSSLNIEVGDVVTVEGPKSTYGSTIELVDVTVLKIEKALVKVLTAPESPAPKEGGEVTVTVAYKGSGVYPTVDDNAKDWLTYKNTEFKVGVPTIFEKSPADTAVVTFTLAENVSGAREGVINFTSSLNAKTSTSVPVTIAQEGSIMEITAAEFNKLADGTALYKVKGVITDIVMDKNDATKYNKYGNFHIQDGTGSVYVYGLLTEAGGASGQDVLTAKGVKVGDVITVVGPKGSYKGSPQMVNGVYEEHTSVKSATAAEFNALADGSDLYQISGKITKIVMDKNDATKYNKYGNFYVADETGEVYVYGLVPITGQSGTDMLTTLGIKEGDIITVVGPKGSYKGSPQMINGFYVSHEAGTNEGSDNPGGEDNPGEDTGDATVISFDQSQLAAAACNGESVKMNDVVSFTNSSDYGTNTVTELRIYKGKELAFSAVEGYVITAIEFACTANGTAKQGPGSFGEGAPSGYTFDAEGPNGKWEGKSNSVKFTATDNQVRIKELKVSFAKVN